MVKIYGVILDKMEASEDTRIVYYPNNRELLECHKPVKHPAALSQ
jgi:hypothetical protein